MAHIPKNRLINAAKRYSGSDLDEIIAALTEMRDEHAKPQVEHRQKTLKQNKTKIQRTLDAAELRKMVAALTARNESLAQSNLGMARQIEIQTNTIRQLRAKTEGQAIHSDNRTILSVAS